MAEGRSNAAIASSILLSVGAVEKHIASIFQKLRLAPSDTDHRRVLAVLGGRIEEEGGGGNPGGETPGGTIGVARFDSNTRFMRQSRDTSTSISRRAESTAPVVVSDSLTKRFGDLVAVDALSFALEAGTITGFLGPNGAGKTTTLRMLLGLAAPTSGRALVFGRPYAQLEQPARRIGAVLEATDFHPGRTGRAHLRTLSEAARLPATRVEEVLRLVELDKASGRRVKGYSLGMRQRLGLAAALLGDPELLVLDEPANGLDPEGVRWLRDFLRAFAAEQRTVLISSHVLAEVAQTVDQVLIISRGKLVIESSLEQLTARVGGPVRVRSPELGKLADALQREGIQTASNNANGLLVHGVSGERVGDIAFAAQVPIHELLTESSSLEEVFLDLTAQPQR
jgi:ABC-2 type transport system ATP-binding protein